MNMEEPKYKPHKIKDDGVELKISGGEGTLQTSEDKDGAEEVASAVQPDPAKDAEQLAALANKKTREQIFLKEHAKRQSKIRFRFAVTSVVVLGLAGALLNFVNNNNPGAQIALTKFQPVAVAAMIGERDASYYAMSDFSDKHTKETPKLLEQRREILERSIDTNEKAGRTALFTRLGTEKFLMNYGDRKAGFKIGDVLIERNPHLVSNYMWRAQVDFDKGNFSEAIKEFDQAAKIIDASPEPVGQAWTTSLVRAVWACIDTGRAEDAARYITMLEKYSGETVTIEELKTQLLLSQLDFLDATELKHTGFYSQAFENKYNDRLEVARSMAESIDPNRHFLAVLDSDIQDWELVSQANMMLGNFSKAERLSRSLRNYYGQRSLLEAKIALARDNPERALNTIQERKKQYHYKAIDRIMVEAIALQRLHQNDKAITIADEGLDYYDSTNAMTGRHFLPLKLVKARAYFELKNYQAALSECNQILDSNSNYMAARLLRLNIYKATGKNNEAEADGKQIKQLVEAFMQGHPLKGQDEARHGAGTM